MCDLVVARTAAVGPGGRRVRRGTVLCADDPAVQARPALYVPYVLAHHCGGGVEQATAAPGEKRDVHPAPTGATGGRPPTPGPGSGVDAWRRYAADVTGTPVQEWSTLDRSEIIELLDAEGK